MEVLRSRKMATMPIKKLLLTMSAPAVISMLVQAIYNVVDSLYLAQYSSSALEAVTIAFPMQILIISVALGIGVGSNAYIAKMLGEGNRANANRAAQNGMFLAVLSIIMFIIIGLTAVKQFIGAYTEDADTYAQGVSYLTIVMCFSFGSIIDICTGKMLQATGNMKVPMLSQLIGACTNIILDPIMIFGMLGFPRMGITGAAIATVISQIVAMTLSLSILIFKKHDIHLLMRGFKPSGRFMYSILKVGFPVMVINALTAFTTIIMNMLLKSFKNAITILGVYFRIQSFIFMPVFGLTQGGMPILGYNYGAGNRKRFSETFMFMIKIALCIMAFGLILFETIPGYIMMMFGKDAEFVNAGAHALRVISLCYIPAAAGVCITVLFQSLGRGFTSLLMSLTRQLVFIIPSAFLLSKYFGMNAVWFCYPIAEVLSLIIFLPIALATFQKEFNNRTLYLKSFNVTPSESSVVNE